MTQDTLGLCSVETKATNKLLPLALDAKCWSHHQGHFCGFNIQTVSKTSWCHFKCLQNHNQSLTEKEYAVSVPWHAKLFVHSSDTCPVSHLHFTHRREKRITPPHTRTNAQPYTVFTVYTVKNHTHLKYKSIRKSISFWSTEWWQTVSPTANYEYSWRPRRALICWTVAGTDGWLYGTDILLKLASAGSSFPFHGALQTGRRKTVRAKWERESNLIFNLLHSSVYPFKTNTVHPQLTIFMFVLTADGKILLNS